MAIGHTTKWFSSAMGGASQVTNAAGQVISNILDPCLKDGFGTITLDSLVVSSGIATLTKSTGHGFLDYQVIEIAGATPSALNAQHRFTRTSATVGTFVATGISDQTATGTITAKTPGLGFAKTFSGTNLAAYKSGSAQSYGHLLRVDDSATSFPRVRGYATMSDINTGTDPYPTDALMSGGGYFPKSSTSTARSWLLAGNDRGFFLNVDYNGTWHAVCFVEIPNVFGSTDPYAVFIGSCGSGAVPGYLSYLYNYGSVLSFMCRDYAQNANSALRVNLLGAGQYSAMGSQAPGSYWTYPPVVPGAGLIGHKPVFICEYQGQLRGLMPGYVAIMSNCRASISPGTLLDLSGFGSKTMFMHDYNVGGIGVDLGGW
jgi:hypothetical protein